MNSRMQRFKVLVSVVVLLAVLFTMIPVYAQNIPERVLTAVSDTYTSSLDPQKVHSSAQRLVVTADSSNICKAYINFNIRKAPSSENTKVFMRITPVKVKSVNESTVSLWGVKSHNWNQSTLKYNNAPAATAKISVLKLEENVPCEVDVTEYVRNNVSTEGYISFMIAEDAETGSLFEFASKESPNGVPELYIYSDYEEPKNEEAEPAPSATPVVNKDYNEIFTTGELASTNTQPIKTEAPYIEKPDLNGIPEDIYVEDFTTVRKNRYLVNYVYGEPEGVAKMLKGRNTAQITFSLAVSPTNLNKMLIGSDCQTVYRSNDGGKTCYESASGLSGNGINHLAFYPDDDNIAFALVTTSDREIANGAWKNVGIHKSTDGGRTWERKESNIISKLDNCKMELMAFGGKMTDGIRPIYASGSNKSGLWRSMDLGETWECIYEGISSAHIEAFDDTVIMSAEFDGILISRDRGESWNNASGNLKGKDIISVTIDPADHTHWICATTDGLPETMDGDLWETCDSGNSWVHIASRDDMLINDLVGVLYGPLDKKTNKARLYLKSNRNQYVIRYSDDDGRTWNRPYYYNPDGYVQVTGAYWASCFAFSANYPDVVVTGVENISVSYDKGSNFYCRSFGRSGARAVAMITNPDNPSDMMFSHIDIGIMRTVPRTSEEWYPMSYMAPMFSQQIPTIRTVYGIGRDPLNYDHIIFGQGGWSGTHQLLESYDNGFNYNVMESGETVDVGPPLLWHPTAKEVIYYGSKRSDDSGKTWKKIPRAVRAMSKTNGDIVYTTNSGYLYISEDRGETWALACSQKLAGVDDGKNIMVDYENPYRVWIGTASNGLWIVDNGVASHKSAAEGIEPTRVGKMGITIEGMSQDPKNPDHVVVGGRVLTSNNEPSPGIYESFDRGETYRTIEIPAPADVFWLAFHPEFPCVYIGTSGGTYVYEYENYDKERPDCYYTDTKGTFCEAEAKWLAENGYIGEDAENDYGRALELKADRYVYEGDFLTLMLSSTDCVSENLDVIFNDVDWEHRYYAQIQTGLENGLVLLSDGDENHNLNILKH